MTELPARWRAAAGALGLALALALGTAADPPPLGAQATPALSAPPTAEAPAVVSPLVRALLAPESDNWLAALDELRRGPDAAREQLLAALRSSEELPRRWRLYHELGEFGQEQDLPFLLTQLRASTNARNRRTIRGAMRALYRPVRDPAESTALIEELALLRSRDSVAYQSDLAGKYVISNDAIMDYHRLNLEPEIIVKMMGFRGTPYASRDAMVKAIRPSFSRREWNDNWQHLLGVLAPLPERIETSGVLRLGVRNPNSRPLLLEAEFEAWFGQFAQEPEVQLIYVPAQESTREDLEVRLIGQRGGHPLRIDVRVRESGSSRYVLEQKILLTP